MAIESVVGRGRIYAGDTPMALTIRVEQTGPMQVTVRAGSFTSTGQARVHDYRPHHAALLADGRAERVTGGRVRVWLGPEHRAQTFVLAADQVIDLVSDPGSAVAYDVDLVSDGRVTDVLVRRKRAGLEEFGGPPPGRTKVHELLYPFTIPPGCADVTPIPICVLTVLPGFPDGTGPQDWLQQTGGA